MRKTLRFARCLLHAAALAFGAFWLVATSAPTGPAQDCFKGIGNPTKLVVVLGTPDEAPAGVQSCNGIDGLAPGTSLVFSVSQGPRPQRVGADACWGYKTDAIAGPTDVTDVFSRGDYVSGGELTMVYGSYAALAADGCRGGWELRLGADLPPRDGPVSPLDLQTGDGWRVRRSIYIDQAQFCDGILTGSGPIGCFDSFSIASITEVSP